MDKLWAPWRINYVKNKKQKKCIFCLSANEKNAKYVIFKTAYSAAVLNIFPYNNGHIMVSPKRHVKDFSKLRDAEILDLVKSINKAKTLLEKVLKPDGYNIGVNLSKAAGAGIIGHMHVHIVPRWIGDTNFMPVIHNTKIISQSLDELYEQLKHVQ